MSGKRLWDKGKAVNQNIHAFTVGTDPIVDKEILTWDILASAAHARMLTEQGLITQEDLKKLLPALSIAYEKASKKKFDIPFELEDCHTALESFLVETCGDAGKKIHLGRSRNDQVLVATRLYVRSSILSFIDALLALGKICLEKAEQTLEVQMPGYTHFQQAMPASVGMWYAAIAENCIELAEEGIFLNEIVNKNPLGVASGFGTPLNINRARTTELLQFKETQRNPINTQNSRGKYESKAISYFTSAASMIEKFSIDLIMYSMQELGFVTIPEEFTTGSSIMPQKRNPDVLELLRANASKMRAISLEIELLTSKLPSSYHRDFQYTKEPLVNAQHLGMTMIEIFSEVIKGVTFNTAKLEQTKTAELYATYEAFRLVTAGLPFRDAYKETAEKLQKGLIDIQALSKDFTPISESLKSECTEATKNINQIEEKVRHEFSVLDSLKKLLSL